MSKEVTLESLKEFVEEIRKTHNIFHGYLPCKCSMGKAFEKLEGLDEEKK